MKCYWQAFLAIVATAAMFGSASAQSNWNHSNEIGSYQSILSKAGYGSGIRTPSQDEIPTPPQDVGPEAPVPAAPAAETAR